MFMVRYYVSTWWERFMSTIWGLLYNAIYQRYISNHYTSAHVECDSGYMYKAMYKHNIYYSEDIQHDTACIEWSLLCIWYDVDCLYYGGLLARHLWDRAFPRLYYAYRNSYRSGHGVGAFIDHYINPPPK